MSPNLKKRLVFGAGMLVMLGGLLLVDHWVERVTIARGINDGEGLAGVGILILLLAIVPAAVYEFATLLAAEHVEPYRPIAGLGCGTLVLHGWATQFDSFQPIATSALAFIVVAVMILAALKRALGKQSAEAIGHMAGTTLATLYLGGLAWFLIALRVKDGQTTGFEGTTWTILLILLVVKATDIGAFFGGKAIGKHKLIPWLSPAKTWEGLVCGLITAAGVGAALAPMVKQLPWEQGMLFGAVIGGVGQLGDLLESLMKRDADVKDSGSSVPGFGGVLDVIDSPLLAAPFAYLMFSLF